ncbi:MAG: glycerol-3-phosphate dehydrogenase/oxidase, partial [Acidimicrobiales bacterium]
MPELPTAFDRSSSLERLGAEAFDVLVVGGGVTGAGVALDAAARGLRTGLVEARDLASGTSSRSSKLVHGGLRYLQQREFGLVYESLAERQALLANAPHLVRPLPFLIPLFGRAGVVKRAVARTYSSALWVYDLSGGLRIGHRHRRVSAGEARAHLPTLRTDRLAAGFVYYDARTDDARLTLAVARTAALDHGAVVATYCPVVGLVEDGSGRVVGARVSPVGPPAGAPAGGGPEPGVAGDRSDPDPLQERGGARPDRDGGAGQPGNGAGGEIVVGASVVVNATGVWADTPPWSAPAGPLTDHRRIRPAKGIHLTVPANRLPCDMAAVLPVPGEHRTIFVVPWGEHVYLGTTDTDYDGPLDEPRVTPEDVAYVLGAVNAAVSSPLSVDDVTGMWAGLRPLLADREGGPAASTADLSRRHQVTVAANGVVSVTGGKLTTYRRMAADTVDEVVTQLKERSRTGGGGRAHPPPRGHLSAMVERARRSADGVAEAVRTWPAIRPGSLGEAGEAGARSVLPGWPATGQGARRPAPSEWLPVSPTRNLPLRGASGTDELRAPGAAEELGVDPAVLSHLVSRHGGEARAVLALVDEQPALGQPLVPGLPYLAAEAVYAARHEMAFTLLDVLARRTRALLRDRLATAAAAPGVAAFLAPELGWDRDETSRQVAEVLEEVAAEGRAAGLPGAVRP